jgi:hypothetical protein
MGVRVPSLVLGVILILLGLIWALQGAGVLKGSPMTGRAMWLGIGVVVVAVGIIVGYLGLGGRRRA